MNKTKLMTMMILITVFTALLAIFISSQAQRCCYNVNAGSRVCTASDLSECCPTPETSYPDYYAGGTGYGPSNFADCQANYYSSAQPCTAISPSCTDYGCCCPGGTAYVLRAECPSTSTFNIYDGRDCSLVCQAPPTTLSPGTCTDTTYKQPPTAAVSYQKGELGVGLTFYAGCAVNNYEISRCTANNCQSYTQIATTTDTFYFDDQVLWDTNYTYKIKAIYALSGESNPLYINVSIGNLECWHKLSNDKFCLHNSSYFEYKDYLVAEGFNPSDNLFLLNVKTIYGSRFNKGFSCNDYNKLTGPDPSCPSDYSKVCIAEGTTASCLASGQCSETAANPYGIFFSKSICEGTGKYCFYDRSPSITNYCYACNPNMLCYDYKSASACSSDNCNIGNCQWIPTIPELGIGVCIDLDKNNCELCALKGTASAANLLAYNEIFDICTLQKASASSTASYPCYVNGSVAISCNVMTCLNYTRTECGTQHIALGANNTITAASQDSCQIKVCEYLNGACHKNADNNYAQDCAGSACESDYFKPTTTIVPVKAVDNTYDYLDIQIYDKTTKSGLNKKITASGSYRTYFCHYGPGESECGTAGHPYSSSTTQLRFYVNDYVVFTYDAAIQIPLFNLTKDNDPATTDNNMIKYYTEDPAHNLGIVGSILVAPTPTPPHILNISIRDSAEVNNIIYTKNTLPYINVTFDEPATIILSRINSSTSDITFNTQYTADRQTYFFIPTLPLSEGTYTFSVRAKDNLDTTMPDVKTKTFVVDITPPTMTLQSPEDGDYSLQPTMQVIFNFSEKALLDEVAVNNMSLNASTFASVDNRLFAKSQNFSDGSKTLGIIAHDYAGNTIYSITAFIVDAIPLMITMTQPPYNVSPMPVFNITIATDAAALCRQSIDTAIQSFNNMFNFSNSDLMTHRLNNVYFSDENNHAFYVKCNDTHRGLINRTFIIRVDISPPQIITAYANPELVVESPPNTTLNIQANEATICKYSNVTQNYMAMEGNFSSYAQKQFSTIHHNAFYLPHEEKNYTYYVACENLAGLVSATSDIRFAVNLSTSLAITVYTPAYNSNNQTKLDIGTNKNAECYWSTSIGSIIYPFTESSGYRHKITPLQQEGSNTYYAKCIASATWSNPVTISFLVDTKKPNMSYVNDSSNILDNPQFSYFLDRLQVKWHGTDASSGIGYYSYLLEDSYQNVIVNWTTSTLDDQFYWVTKDNEPNWIQVNGTKLNLTNLRTYKFKVKATDYANWTSDVMSSNGVTVDVSKLPGHCQNSLFDNGTETDVDCGIQCPSCGNNKNCLANSDCISGYCINSIKKCAAPSCTDGIRNGDETDTDCGGSCQSCQEGKKCIKNNDCTSNLKCKQGTCKKDDDKCKDGKLSGDETDIDCGGSCDPCEYGENCLQNRDCATNYCSLSKKCANRCNDGAKNGDETDIDCGGLACSKCAEGRNCLINGDCSTNYCGSNKKCATYAREAEGTETGLASETETGGFNWMVVFLIILIIAALGGGGFAVYKYYYLPYLQKKKPYYAPRMRSQVTPARPELKQGFIQRPASSMQRLREIKRAAEEKEREKIFGAFEEEKPIEKIAEKIKENPIEQLQERIKEKEEKPKMTPEVEREEAKMAYGAKKPEDIFARLKKLAEKPKGAVSELKKIPKAKEKIQTTIKEAKIERITEKDYIFKRLKEIISKKLKGDYAKKLLALAESKGMAKQQDLKKAFSDLLKTKRITSNLVEEILLHLIGLGKITKSDAKVLLSDLANQKLISRAQIKKILSKLGAA